MATTFSQESFLDLKFNNHWVSEYGLVVVSDGSRYSEALFPEFDHSIVNVPGKTGTVYWGTTIKGRNITKKLVTDGMTSRQYTAFKSNFRPGTFAELRFSESAYKYAYAYINDAAEFNFIPFDTTTVIKTVTYKDTLYKGECDLTFFLPDPYFYSDYYLGKKTVAPTFDYTTTDWFVESGLPLDDWLALQGGNIQLALGNWYGTAPSSATTIRCYHAGSSIARANLNFKKTYGDYTTEGTFLTDLWTNYVIDDIEITIPRAIKDIKTTYELVGVHDATWTADKIAVQIELEESLDSSIAGILRQMVNATGSGLTYTTVTALKTGIRSVFINNKTYAFSINGIELQSRMTSISTLTNPINPPGGNFSVDDNISDSVNNKYITLPATFGAAAGGQLTYKLITSNISLVEPEVYFRNTYE